jgi:hypothetical protein
MRPEIALTIPIQRQTEQLERTLKSIEQHTENYRLVLVEEPTLNVSEARQQAWDALADVRYVCWLDDDSEMVHDGWLDEMFKTLDANPEAGAVFGGEWWGDEERTPIVPVAGEAEVAYGPAACMLMDRERIPASVQWDSNIGLRSGWLGGDFEEVDYCFRLRREGLRLLRCTNALFHHTGGRTTLRDFGRSDRARTVRAMKMLLTYKYAKAPEDDDWFNGLQYVKADARDDTMLAPGTSLRDCYAGVIRRNGLAYVKGFQRMGLV